jgi:hypothetical protein
MLLETVPKPSTIAFSKDAFPTRRRRASEPFIQPAKTSPALLRKSSSAIQAFVRFAVTTAAQLLESQSRSLGPAVRNLSPGVALALIRVARTSAFHPW